MKQTIKYLILAIVAYIVCDLLWIMFYDGSETLSLKTAIGMINDPMSHKLKIMLEKTLIFGAIFFAEMWVFKNWMLDNR